ncbi:hypothetical protein GCM10009093_12040 [Brevundimonas terrae]|uniref:Uncharacterized protein n=1 Tax=Brevundimonas terrae TaxID=363631 RepID=A0ABP3I111_9CAUL
MIAPTPLISDALIFFTRLLLSYVRILFEIPRIFLTNVSAARYKNKYLG